MKLIVGLGNPGQEYENTRHNIGFRVVDYFCEQNNCSEFIDDKKYKALISKNKIAGHDVLFIKPKTYMNLSGEAVSLIGNFYKIDYSKDLMVIYDDVDLAIGNIRFRNSGSAGTHNGMKSIVACIGTQDFFRLRIGIESRGEYVSDKQDLHSFVLSKFVNEEEKILGKVMDGVGVEIDNFIKEQISIAFSKSFI